MKRALVVNIHHFKKHIMQPAYHPPTHPPTSQDGYLHGSLGHVRVLLLLWAAAGRWLVVGHLGPVALAVCVGAFHELFLMIVVHVLPQVCAFLGELGEFHFLALLAVLGPPLLHEECVRAHSSLGLVRILVLLGRHFLHRVVGELVSRERQALHLGRDGEGWREFEFWRGNPCRTFTKSRALLGNFLG